MPTDSIVVPVIDLVNFPAELEKLASAATGLGCFRIVNHGMPATLPAEMKAVARSLFEMPLEAKLLNVNDKIFNGSYLPLKKLQRLIESFGIYDAASPADVHSFCSVMKVSQRQRCALFSFYFILNFNNRMIHALIKQYASITA